MRNKLFKEWEKGHIQFLILDKLTNGGKDISGEEEK